MFLDTKGVGHIMDLTEPQLDDLLGRMHGYVDAVFRAIWVDGRNMNDAATVASVLQQSGFDAQRVLALTADPEIKDRLKAVTRQAVERGVFGAPTFITGDEMFFGNDRLDFLRQSLKAAA